MQPGIKRLYIELLTVVMIAVLILPIIGTGIARASPSWYDSNWQYRKKITIDSTKVTDNLTNFPVLVNLSFDLDLASDAQNDGDDILFTSANGTRLNHEIEKFDGANGQLVAWINIPALSSTTDTDIYMYYGNASASNQENITATWDANYVAVWHLKEDPSGTAPQMMDSTANNHDGTSQGSWSFSDQMSGLIDGSLDFNQSTDRIYVGTFDVIAGGTGNDGITLETWFNYNCDPDGRLISKAKKDKDKYHWWALNIQNTGAEYRLRFRLKTNGKTTALTAPPSYTVPLNQWVYAVATYAGSNHDMCKRTPVHDSQKKDGGVLRRIGVWRRARYFSQDFTCRAEIENVRNNVGMLDASTLGKFKIWGPDALNALQRVYVGDMSQIADGKIKYSAMCNEDGCIVDDGVVVKRAENEYYFTTSTGRAGSTAEWFRYHTRYDGWNFNMVNLTDALGVINLAGPNARKVLQKITDTDVSNKAYPFAAYREFTIQNEIAVRSMRLGFVGELSYELHVASSYMQTLWDLLVAAGKEFGMQNFGLEAQNVLRLEKGHIIIGAESEIRTTLHDVGLGFLWSRQKPDAKTVGAVALQQTEKQAGRLKLVGFKMENPARAPKDGSIVVENQIRGYVCTARHSMTLNESVGLALVDATLAEAGRRLQIYEDECEGQLLYATVVPTPFYDPEGNRLKM